MYPPFELNERIRKQSTAHLPQATIHMTYLYCTSPMLRRQSQDAVNKNTQAISSVKIAIQNTASQINANNQAVSTAQAKVTAAQAALAAAERPTTTTESQNKYDAAEFPQSQLTGAETVSVAYPSNGEYVPNADKINQYMFE